jgi:hypothetical protein
MRARLAENDSYAARFAIVEYRDHPENGNAFQLCVGTYICGDKSIRKTMEEELKGSRVLQVARDLVTKNERKNKTNEVAETGFIAKLKRNRLLQRPPETRLSGKSP